MSQVQFVDYKEALSFKVGEFIVQNGFEIADPSGFAIESPIASYAIGVLRRNPYAKPKKYFFGLITGRMPRRELLGFIWVDNNVRGANKEHWVFEVKGRKYVPLAKELAKKMTSTFHVNILINLVDEHPGVEARWSDYGD